MLPPGHAAVGYLAFSLCRRAWHRDVPMDSSMVWLLFATQLPDLIDKPLAWSLGVLPTGRSLGHSVVFALPLVLLVEFWFRRRNRPADGDGFAVGYFSHLFADSAFALRGGAEWITFLVWPLLASPEYGSRPSIWPPAVYFSSIELAVGAVVAALWIADGMPGLGYVRAIRGRLRKDQQN